MNTRTVSPWLTSLSFCAACYSPHDSLTSGNADDAGDSTGEDGSGSSSMSGTGPSPTTTAATTAPGTTDASEDDASSSGMPTTAADSTDDGPAPFCGDGTVDADEDCDAGDANAFEAECRPDCTFNTCGDGYVWDGVEACDDGEDDNILEVGACAPDCSRVIEEKVITFGDNIMGGDFGNNAVAFADSSCSPGYSALFAVPGLREASASPFEGDGQVDWVLEPFTAYTTPQGTLVWITDQSALLGVRDGAAQDLLVNPAFALTATRAITGMNADWTALNSNTCNGWQSSSDAQNARYGNPGSTSVYLNSGTTDCDNWSWQTAPLQPIQETTYVYCVEQ